MLLHILGSAATLLETPVGQVALAPFRLFAAVVLPRELTLDWLLICLSASAVVVLMATLVLKLDAFFAEAVVQRERVDYRAELRDATAVDHVAGPDRIDRSCQREAPRRPTAERWPTTAWLGGAGPIAWRQAMGAKRQWNSLAVSMVVPGMLALLPIMVCTDGHRAALHVAGAVTFYSFLLLPTAMKFDFRRDIQRMAVLKALPIHPAAIAVGQVATPSLLAFFFQAIVLGITLAVRPFPIWMLLSILLLLAQLNVLIFAVDNLVFLLYPYRLNQEGIEIFLRTTLIFTAKGLISRAV